MTTLEEVFLQLEDTSEENKDENKEVENQEEANGSQNVLVPPANTNLSGSQASNLHHTGVELNDPGTRKVDGMSKFTGQLLGLLKVKKLFSCLKYINTSSNRGTKGRVG
jgi:hypothetical protein